MAEKNPPSGFGQLLAEARRRHVVRFALGYAAAAFVVLQLAEIVLPAFGFGEAGLRVVVVLVGLGFLPALVLAWVYDLTTEGLQRTGDEAGAVAAPSRLALGALLVMTVVVTGGLGLYLADQGVFTAEPVADGTPAPPVQPVAFDPDAPIRSLAVLPLEDFSPDGDQAYFTSGMHEELIAKLSVLEDVRVVSRTSVMKYRGTTMTSPEIGRELGVDVLVEGSVSRSGDRVRVTLQVIHAPSDAHIQTLQWDREDVADLLAFQTEVAHAVVHEIGGSHAEEVFQTVASSSVAPAAQEAYFRARHEYDSGTPDGLKNALGYFEEAVAADSDFAAAMAGVASARFLLSLEDSGVAGAQVARAHEEALAAIEMDPSSVEAKEVLTFIERSMPRVAKSAVVIPPQPLAPQTRIVVMADGADSVSVEIPSLDTAWLAAMTGLGSRIEEHVRRRTLSRDTGPTPDRDQIEARMMIGTGRFVEAARTLERVVVDEPGAAESWNLLARAHVGLDDPRGAVEVVERWHESGSPGSPDEAAVASLTDAVAREGSRGYWSWQLERLQAGLAAGEPVARVDLAAAAAGVGDRSQALRWLGEAIERHEPGVLSLRADPVWDVLRGDPGFRDLAERVRELRYSSGRTRPPGG